jgi:hypothetical protein
MKYSVMATMISFRLLHTKEEAMRASGSDENTHYVLLVKE